MKILLFTILVTFSDFSFSAEISGTYRGILVKYAEAALQEFDMLLGQSASKNLTPTSATIASGKDNVGRMFYVVLYPSQSGSVYVAMELTKDGFLEIHSRGGSLISPENFATNFSKHISTVVHYPNAT